MLALVSSRTATVIGSTSFLKTVSGWGRSLSSTSKSSFVRFGTRRLSRSVTVAYSATTWVPVRNSGAWGAWGAWDDVAGGAGGGWAAAPVARNRAASSVPAFRASGIFRA